MKPISAVTTAWFLQSLGSRIIPAKGFAQNKLVIAIQPTVASDEMLSKAKPLQQFIEKSLGGKTKVEIYVPSSYAAVVESLRFGHAHMALYVGLARSVGGAPRRS